MRLIRKIKKGCTTLHRILIQKSMYLTSHPSYRKRYVKFLRKQGMDIPEMPNYICNDVHFDGTDYSIIHLGKNCTISTGVHFLTHDYAVYTVFAWGTSGMDIKHPEYFMAQNKINRNIDLRGIYIGDNVFVGAKALLLPGTHIGKNSIVGAGAVVKGTYPEESIIIGNPARIVGKTSEWLNKKAEQALEETEND